MILGEKGNVGGFPEEDLVVGLPGQPKAKFRQFAGYVDVDVKSGRSLFYYFTEADGEPEKKPLTLWLNGGIILLFRPSLLFFFKQNILCVNTVMLKMHVMCLFISKLWGLLCPYSLALYRGTWVTKLCFCLFILLFSTFSDYQDHFMYC
jgi:Serine carboxypeptidase